MHLDTLNSVLKEHTLRVEVDIVKGDRVWKYDRPQLVAVHRISSGRFSIDIAQETDDAHVTLAQLRRSGPFVRIRPDPMSGRPTHSPREPEYTVRGIEFSHID